jgi:hypothetical protein
MLGVLAQLAGPTPSSGQCQPSGIGDRQPDYLDRPPHFPRFPLFRRRQPIPHQGVERRVREAVREHDCFGDTEWTTGEQP